MYPTSSWNDQRMQRLVESHRIIILFYSVFRTKKLFKAIRCKYFVFSSTVIFKTGMIFSSPKAQIINITEWGLALCVPWGKLRNKNYTESIFMAAVWYFLMRHFQKINVL